MQSSGELRREDVDACLTLIAIRAKRRPRRPGERGRRIYASMVRMLERNTSAASKARMENN